MRYLIKLFPCLLLVFCSCDILRNSPYHVVAWTPGEGQYNEPGKLAVSLLLSHESDKVKTEQAFVLTEDGRSLKGDFKWEGSRLLFLPASPLEINRNYTVTLGTGAQSTKGISLEHRFTASFSTGPPARKSLITGTVPVNEGIMQESRGEFNIFFSEPVSLSSCMDFIVFNPSTPGSWRLLDNERIASFTPRDPWQNGIIYRVKIDNAFKNYSGTILGSEYFSAFSYGEDSDKPFLLKVNAIFPMDLYSNMAMNSQEIAVEKFSPGTAVYLSMPAFSGWEKESRLELVFSEAVDLGSLRNQLSTEPHTTLLMESPPLFSDRAVFRFADLPAWGSSFLFRLASGVKDRAGNESLDEYQFRINFTGPMSKAPVLKGIRLPMAPGKDENQEPLFFSANDLFKDLPIEAGDGQYPYGTAVPSWIELYFETTAETTIEHFSLMDLFRVDSTNQALTFSPRSIVSENFTMEEAEAGMEKFNRLEVRGFLSNSINTGIVTFRISPGLRDTSGNQSSTDFRISLLK